MTSDSVKYTNEDLKDHHGVSAVIKDDLGRVLIQEHAKYGFWTIPVGKVKEGQEVVEGLKEEVFEECNLKIEKCQEIRYQVFEYLRKEIPVKVFTHLFEINKYSGTLENKEPHKHLQQRFMSIEDIEKLSYLSDTTLMYLDTLGIQRKQKI